MSECHATLVVDELLPDTCHIRTRSMQACRVTVGRPGALVVDELVAKSRFEGSRFQFLALQEPFYSGPDTYADSRSHAASRVQSTETDQQSITAKYNGD